MNRPLGDHDYAVGYDNQGAPPAALGAAGKAVMQKLLRADPSLLLRWALIAAGVLVAFGLVFHKFETLFAGLLGLLGGLGAFIGVLRAAEQQVGAAQQAAKDQIAAMQQQIDDTKAARAEDEKHKREVERAYVAGGGLRLMAQIPLGQTIVFRDLFELHITNHGKPPARLYHVAVGFCDAAALPAAPRYDEYRFPWYDAIGPGAQSRRVTDVHIPPRRYERTAICGRYYWRDIWDHDWSSGFVYEIPSNAARGNVSISIEAPASYWDDRPGDCP